MVSTLDFESNNPSSILGMSFFFEFYDKVLFFINSFFKKGWKIVNLIESFFIFFQLMPKLDQSPSNEFVERSWKK